MSIKGQEPQQLLRHVPRSFEQEAMDNAVSLQSASAVVAGFTDWSEFNLNFDMLFNRLVEVKRKHGVSKAISSQTLSGETRTFAEMLDQEVEKVVLFYLRVQGSLANQVYQLRSRQQPNLSVALLTEDKLNALLKDYRSVAIEVMRLLTFLEYNNKNLQQILKQHDLCYDQKLTALYFDTRGANGSLRSSPLLQLYHQEGILAIISFIRRAFEDIHEAKYVLVVSQGNNLGINGSTDETLHSDFFRGPSSGVGSLRTGLSNRKSVVLPRASFLDRVKSTSSMQRFGGAFQAEDRTSKMQTGRLSSMNRGQQQSQRFEPLTEERLFNLEPILKDISNASDRVFQQQQQTLGDYMTTNSEIGLESAEKELKNMTSRSTRQLYTVEFDRTSLFVSLLLTFLYMTNQYIVAPTGGQYAHMLGQSEALNGLIVGLSPAAALISAIVYSAWSNYTFFAPLLASVICGIIGNLCYAVALQRNSSILLVIGRLVTGLGGCRGIARRYIVDHVPKSFTNTASGHFVAAGALGLASGPLLAGVINSFNTSFVIRVKGSVTLVQYELVTAPGWIMLALWTIALLVLLLFFKEPPNSERNLSDNPFTMSAIGSRCCASLQYIFLRNNNKGNTTNLSRKDKGDFVYEVVGELELASTSSLPAKAFDDGIKATTPFAEYVQLLANERETATLFGDNSKQMKLPLSDDTHSCFELLGVDIYIVLFMYFANKVGQEIVVTSAPDIFAKQFGVHEGVGYMLAVLGTLVLPGNIVVSYLSGRVDSYTIITTLGALSIGSVVIMVNFWYFDNESFIQYFMGMVLLFCLLNSMEGTMMALLSRLVSPELARGTFNSGLLSTEVGTFGRVVGDFTISLLLSDDPSNLTVPLYTSFGLLMALSVLLMVAHADKFNV